MPWETQTCRRPRLPRRPPPTLPATDTPVSLLYHHHHHYHRHHYHIITSSPSPSQAPFQTPRRSRTLLNQRPRRRAPKWRIFPPSPTQTCLLPHILLTRFPFPANLPFCNKKPCVQPSQYLNNNLGGHRGDIDEVGEQLNIIVTMWIAVYCYCATTSPSSP